MVQALVNIDERANRILNVIKAKYGLRDKSDAINVMAIEYEKELLEPELRPKFVEKMKKRQKEKTVRITNFAKHYGLE
ncbi:MAG: DUF2683 family protein [Methanobacteriota archaeon]|nr:DUF2683 family protein [Candidatus Hydrothermarchaeota archaeon]